ncbi:NADH-quinone oxidoreductase subunit C [Bacillus niacini]|uniref:NAD(P)H dehydrogenase subunit J n=1 Tax=Neobacillus niacini TaxID=86668 RepID=A0A852TFA2_9BACI|nr:NADH-quinone oxidoreductase subunit C [Neobacillus niacini]NYE05998.1 NADH-quinone oxidoreductase subunit C [Neobacillus niacini]
MSGEKDLDQLKREAAEKAKAAALAKRQAKAAGESQGAQKQEDKPSEQALSQVELPVQQEQPAVTPAEDGADLAKKKAAAAAKAKAAALAKKKREGIVEDEAPAPVEAVEETTATTEAPEDGADLAKQKAAAVAKAKAAAVAKAKAAAAAKRKAMELAAGNTQAEETPAAEAETSDDGDDLAKKKAAAVAKAKAAAAAKRKAMELAAGSTPVEETPATEAETSDDGDDLAKKKAAAVAKAKAAAAAKAKAAGTAKGGDVSPADTAVQPSPNQPFLDKYRKVIKENLGPNVLEDSYINKLSKDVPTLVAKKDTYFKVAQFLKYNELLGFDYLSELHGTDFVTHMEVYVHLFSYKNRQSVALKVKIDRDEPTIESLQPIWAGANWPECEAYDLLGIKFTGHPNLHRIMLGEDWVGHPLRKDYEPYDVEV